MTEPLSCPLQHRGVVRIAGADHRVFLQGLISNDINLCTSGKPIYAALLTPQGKFLHDILIAEDGDGVLIDCEATRAGDLLKRLSAYKLRAKVTFENVTGAYEVWASWNGMTPEGFYVDPRLTELGARAILKKPSGLHASSDVSVYDKHRLSLGVPDGSRDMLIEQSTLFECNMDFLQAISWSKGCYMGQELTARMHYRALVKKRLFPVTIEGPTPVEGTSIQLMGEDIGEMRSSAGAIGLALLNIEKMEGPLTSGTSKLKARKPPWLKI